MSKTIANGNAVDIAIQAGHSLKLAWLGGSYTATGLAGFPNMPVALATNVATDQTLGPYATSVMIRLKVSAIGRVAWDSGLSQEFRPPGERFTRQDDGVSVTLTGVGAAAAFLADGGGSAVGVSAGLASNLYVYGHSYTASPGVACTSGAEFFTLLAASKRVSAATSYGVSSGRLIDMCFDLIGQSANTPKAGSTWNGTRRGFVAAHCTINDAYNPPSSAANVQGLPLTATQLQNWGDDLFTAMAILSSSGRVETSTGTTNGTWTTATFTYYSGGSLLRTSQQGAYVDVTVTVPASGYVYYLTYATVAAQGEWSITEGGTTYATGVSRPCEAVWSRREGASMGTHPILTKITATPGVHVFRITKTDPSANQIYPDAFLLPHASPVQVAWLRDPALALGNGVNATNSPQANLDITLANLTALEAQTRAVLAQFTNATFLDASLIPATDLSVVDTIHPNDRGMVKEASVLDRWIQSKNADGQYTTL